MSAGRLLKEVIFAILKVFRGVLGWIIIAPVAMTTPKRQDRIAVIGRDNGKFLDNSKYFFLQASALLYPSSRPVFVTERRDVVTMLENAGYRALLFPSWMSIRFLLGAGVLVLDSSEWVLHFKRFLLVGSRKVQLWHGVGYKRIEMDKWKNEAHGNSILSAPWMPYVRRIMKTINGRIVRFDVVNTTSGFYRENVFEPAMLSRHFTAFGYPRNAFGKLTGAAAELAWANVDGAVASKAEDWVVDGRKIVLVTPTFRDTRASDTGFSDAVIGALDDFCEREKVEFIFKFHPLEHGASRVRGQHLHVCDPDSDVYPLMPLSSALITDYSSIYMDYLLLDKPVVFYVPDLEEYMLKDRQFQFDFEEMTPGPKLKNWDEVLRTLLEQWKQDDYTKERAKLHRLAFDDLPQEQATPKLIAFMQEKGWIPPATRT